MITARVRAMAPAALHRKRHAYAEGKRSDLAVSLEPWLSARKLSIIMTTVQCKKN